MEKYLKKIIVVQSPTTGQSQEYRREKIIGRGGSGIVSTYRAASGERVIMKVSDCGSPTAAETGTQEVETALAVTDALQTDCAKAGFPLCLHCDYTAKDLVRRPLDYKYVAPCFYAVFPYVQYNLIEWLKAHPRRDPKVVRDMFMQTLTILRCLRSRGYYYTDIKPSNFGIVHRDGKTTPYVQITDLGGITLYGKSNMVISPGRLPKK